MAKVPKLTPEENVDWSAVRSGTTIEVSNYEDFRSSYLARYMGYNKKSQRTPHIAYAIGECKYRVWMYARIPKAAKEGRVKVKDIEVVKRLIDKSRAIMINIGKERDELREVYSEMESFIDSTDEGLREMENALDTLSQYV